MRYAMTDAAGQGTDVPQGAIIRRKQANVTLKYGSTHFLLKWLIEQSLDVQLVMFQQQG